VANLATWHGSPADFERLANALRHNCECDLDNPASPPCPAHRMITDQAVLDHLAFVGANRKTYWHAEFDPAAEWF
jgi:hypothetical protein